MEVERGRGCDQSDAKRQGNWESHGGGVRSKVRKDGKRVYYIRYSWGGRRIIEKVGLSIERARGRIEARREAMEDPAYIPTPVKRERAAKPPKVPTFKEFGELFLEQYASKRVAKDSWFRPMVSRLAKVFSKRRLDVITRLEIERYLTMRAKARHPATVNHDIRFLKLMLKTAVAWKYLEENVAESIQLLKVPPPDPDVEAGRFLTQKQTDALIDAAPDHVRPCVQLALLTGMRRGELLGLRWPQIKDGWIRLHETKSSKERRIPVTTEIATILRTIRKRHPRYIHGYVLVYNGERMKSFKRSWENTRAAAKLPRVRFHDLRHTWASRLLRQGVSPFELQKLGGWGSLEMVTQRYGHFAEDDRRAAMERLSGTVGRIV